MPSHSRNPWLGALILTHMFQTEVKSKMSAFKERLQREPAFAGRCGSERASPRICNKCTARGDNRPKPPDQTVNARPLPFFHAIPTCEALVIVLDQPTVSIPVHPLPGLFKRRGRNRGKIHPFQRLLGISRLFFPDANDPHGQRLLAGSWRVRASANT